MLLKITILLPVLYFLTIAQVSFLPHFGFAPNIVFILIVLSIIFVPSFSLALSFSGGLFLDIFSGQFFGFYILMLLAITFFIRIILKRYVQIPLR